jgi:hypothetical protein
MGRHQITSKVLMVRPIDFKLNEQTAVNNYYQQEIDDLSDKGAQNRALQEFDEFVQMLRDHGITVTVIRDRPDAETPDSIFPNNWVTFHHDGTVALYPMFAENRRLERRADILETLRSEGHIVENVKDFSAFEDQSKFLEGTGSMILDRDYHIVYAAISDRTDPEVLDRFCEEFSYKPITFTAYQSVEGERLPIYHTNVMMSLTDKLSVICLTSIDDPQERKSVEETLLGSGKEICEISEAQVSQFAGNMLSLNNDKGEEFLIMSTAAHNSLSKKQIAQIEKYYTILSSSLDTIETLGGGGARCMMAEVFLPTK